MRQYERRDPLKGVAVPQEDAGRGLGAVHVAVPVDHRALSEDLRVGPELPLQVPAEFHIVSEVRFRLDPGELLSEEDDRFVEERIRGLRIFSAEVLLRSIADPALLEPTVEALLAASAPLALKFHPVRRVDHVGFEQALDFVTDSFIGSGIGMEEHLPDLLAGNAEMAQHLLTEQHRGEAPLSGDIEHRTAVLPLADEAGDLAAHDVEPPRRVPGDAVGIDDEQELLIELLLVGEAMDVLVGL
jgi:hypothetical protein